MKKIIEGKVYNTETAEEIGSFWNGLGGNDFRNLNESLYKTKKGAWFLYGQGGAMTRWSESNGNTTWGSSGIMVLSEESARRWCETHDIDAETIERHFTIDEA